MEAIGEEMIVVCLTFNLSNKLDGKMGKAHEASERIFDDPKKIAPGNCRTYAM